MPNAVEHYCSPVCHFLKNIARQAIVDGKLDVKLIVAPESLLGISEQADGFGVGMLVGEADFHARLVVLGLVYVDFCRRLGAQLVDSVAQLRSEVSESEWSVNGCGLCC